VPADDLCAGLVQTANQAERAKGYRYYLEQAAALPCFVGAHWFQWADEPVLGRMDGENYDIGFVDVTNRPYLELVEAAKTTHRRLHDVHAGTRNPRFYPRFMPFSIGYFSIISSGLSPRMRTDSSASPIISVRSPWTS
jgi:hypothetical protein